MDRDEVERELGDIPLFEDLAKECRDLLVDAIVAGDQAGPEERWGARFLSWSPGDVIVEQDASTPDIHILVEGKVHCVQKQTDSSVVSFGLLEPTNWFGEMPLLSNHPHQEQFEAVTACRTLTLKPAEFKKLYEHGLPNSVCSFREEIDAEQKARAIERELRAMTLFRGSPRSKAFILLGKALVSGEKAGEKDNWRARFLNWSPGEVIVQQGTYASDFHLLLKGTVRCVRLEADSSVLDLGTIRSKSARNWFGEMPALSNQPHYARYEAVTACTTLTIEAAGFKKLYEDKKDPKNPIANFKEQIDAGYKDRDLLGHLRTAPLLKGLSSRDLESIAKGAELLTLAEGEVIAQQNAPADAVYLVRSGIVKCMIREKGEDRFHAALCANSSFGERAFTPGGLWPGTYTVMARCDLVKLPRALFDAVLGSGPSMDALQGTATQLVRREEGLVSPAGKHLVKAADVLVIDLLMCTRCNSCVESCVAVHDDGVPRLSKRGLVNEERTQMLTSACYHCRTPDCMLSCKFGAIRRTLQGAIDFVYDACTGCKECERSCPYGVIRMVDVGPADEEKQEEKDYDKDQVPITAAPAQPPRKAEPRVGLIERIRMRLFPDRKASGQGSGSGVTQGQKAIKCDFCAGLPYEACVYNCPCGAIRRVDPQDLDFEPSRVS